MSLKLCHCHLRPRCIPFSPQSILINTRWRRMNISKVAGIHRRPRPFTTTKDYMITSRQDEDGSRRRAPVEPRLSASLIVLNDRNEVLMVQRNMLGAFAGAFVFPGGVFDAAQDDAIEMTAIRETFEETGVLLASSATGQGIEKGLSDVDFERARKDIHSGKLRFKDFLARNGLRPDLQLLLPFTTWITPEYAPKRFRAQFFVAFLPTAPHITGPISGSHHFRLPTPDSPEARKGGQAASEVVSTCYIHLQEVLAGFERHEIGLMPPQFYLLKVLSDVLEGNTASGVEADAQKRRALVEKLSRGSFGNFTFRPVLLKGPEGKRVDGKQILTYEGDETRGGHQGTLHRTILEPQKGTTLPASLQVIRSFDLFKGFDDIVQPLRSKL